MNESQMYTLTMCIPPVLFLAILAISRFCEWAYSWINDSEMPEKYIFVSALIWLLGSERANIGYLNTRNRKTHKRSADIDNIVAWSFISSWLVVPIMSLFQYAPVIPACIGIIFGLAHLTRFTVRLNKKLNAHTENTEVHR